jgi:predicted enzyme related to lactoylglutathione lyase
VTIHHPADDPARAQEFYRGVFDWKINSMPGMEYALLSTTDTDEQGAPKEPGAINGGMFKREPDINQPVITIEVADIDQSLKAIEASGGSTVRPREAVADMGFAAYFKDSEGNLLGLWENAG